MKITQISCGFKHTLVKTSNFKVYAWGNNSYGQLGKEKPLKVPYPVEVKFDSVYSNHIKIYQIAAGMRCSYFLCDQGFSSILFCGKTTFRISPIITKLDLSITNTELTMDNRFAIVKICTVWNKQLSILQSTVIDINELKEKKVKYSEISLLITNLQSKWEESNSLNIPQSVKNSSLGKYIIK